MKHKKHIYLNEFHRKRSERLKKQLSLQPKASLADAMEQYERIKRGSSQNGNRSRQAHARSLAARHLLLHPREFNQASTEDVLALAKYVREKRWKSLYHHDRRMYKLLEAGAQILKDHINIPSPPRPSPLEKLGCLAEVTRDLRDETGSLSGRKIAGVFGIRLSRLAHLLGQKCSMIVRYPSAGFLQSGLMYFEQIAWLRAVLPDKTFRTWLRSPNSNLESETPLNWLDDGRLQSIVDLVHDMLTGAPT